MINTNTQQNTTITPSKIDTSSIYLKKSELPKNVSSFKNDVKYISESALECWLKAHTYISKSEIEQLIKKANLVVIDNINKQYDDEAINSLNKHIEDIKGEIVAIKDRLNTDYLLKDDAKQEYLKKEDYHELKDASVISDAYNTLEELRASLNEVMNGFYIVNSERGDSKDLVIVKNHQIINIIKDGIPQQQLIWQEE